MNLVLPQTVVRRRPVAEAERTGRLRGCVLTQSQ